MNLFKTYFVSFIENKPKGEKMDRIMESDEKQIKWMDSEIKNE